MPAALPAALGGRLTRGAQAIGVAGGAAARWRQQCVRCPWFGLLRERQLAALGYPDSIGCLRVHSPHRTPGPSLVFDAIRSIGQRLRPVRHDLVMAELLLSPLLLLDRRGRQRDPRHHHHDCRRESTHGLLLHLINGTVAGPSPRYTNFWTR